MLVGGDANAQAAVLVIGGKEWGGQTGTTSPDTPSTSARSFNLFSIDSLSPRRKGVCADAYNLHVPVNVARFLGVWLNDGMFRQLTILK